MYSLLLDPPWAERGGGQIKRGADRHYPLLPTSQIAPTVRSSGLWPAKGENASVWLWTTRNFLEDAFQVLRELDAKYVTNLDWVKTLDDNPLQWAMREMPDENESRNWERILSLGLGQRFRSAHEHLLYARMGRVDVPPPAHRVPSVKFSPPGKHSAKPDWQYDVIQSHDGNLPADRRIEFFARSRRWGWTSWGPHAGLGGA